MSGACLKLEQLQAQAGTRTLSGTRSQPHQQQAVFRTSHEMFRWLDLSPSLASERQKCGGEVDDPTAHS